MYSIFIFLLSTLAIWRIGHMILDENGPFNIFGKLANYTDKLKYKDGGLKQPVSLYTSPSPRDRTRSRMPSSA